jgi:hypothetical protein
MKRFKDEDYEENKIENVNNHETTFSENIPYKRFQDEKKKDDFITPSMKNFRKIIGGLLIVFIAYSAFFQNNSDVTNYKSNLVSGKLEGVKAGDILSKDTVKLQAKDFSIDTANSYGKIQLSIWNFADKEDGDYVQVFVNGAPQTEPFVIRHKPTNVDVPDKGIIQVRGIRDGSNNGITYGLFFNKTGETYLNTVPLNADNTYTLKNTK